MSDRFNLGPPPRLAYCDSVIDRAAHRRNEGAALEGDAVAYAIAGEHVVLKRGQNISDPVFTLAEARSLAAHREAVFLGLHDGRPSFAVALDPAAIDAIKANHGHLVIDLRSIVVQGLVAPEHLPPLAEAKALISWHARHRFCANCGTPTNMSDAGWKRDCPQCHVMHFPRTDPVVIMLAVDGDRCLLGRQSRFGTGMWSCLAGFVEPGETIEEAVRRETLEEAGIRCGDVQYFATQPWPFPMSLMIGCHARALNSDITVDKTELEDVQWFSRQEAADMLLKRHPRDLSTPPPLAIAYHIIRAWVEGKAFGGR
jgi:NAD+ diphosphatase